MGKSRLLVLVGDAWNSVRKQIRSRWNKSRIDWTPLERIRALYPEAHMVFIHLPEKGEVLSKRYRYDVKKELEARGIVYEPCLQQMEWSEDMFLANDSHPNAKGYAALREYVWQKVFAAENSPR